MVLLVATSLLATGCSYMCHSYEPFTSDTAQDMWQVRGEVGRRLKEDISPPPGSVYHWPPDESDRWWVDLTPIAADTTFWHAGDVELAELKVVADTDTISVAWTDKIDLVAKARDYTYADGSHQVHGLEFGKFKFESEFFHLPAEAPATLKIQCSMILRDSVTGEVRLRQQLEFLAVLDRHRRWGVVDAAEM